MFTFYKKVLGVVLLVSMAVSPIACVNLNKQPNDEPKKEVNIGGNHGVTVEH